ncbi:hypothetical protein Q8F55_002819 [Vanrija albida]|uniref:Fatty acid hydroxylase domain-containing protein n=1 Tax=Vanrija albida TaxID=181172 RepID=A0ABR3QBF0_9TREE
MNATALAASKAQTAPLSLVSSLSMPLPALSLPPLVSQWLQGIALGVAASSIAIGYSEVLFQGTAWLYKRGTLLRYYPLPKDRGATTAWINSMSFTVPTAVYALVYRNPGGPAISFDFNILTFAVYMALYMVIHDTFFYWCHRTFHVVRPLYDWLHAMHHEYSYAMHVYIVGHAEVVENFIQVGLPFILWTYIAGHNWWYWLLPLSFVIFSTLIGHSGYRSHYSLMFFHPLAAPVALASGSAMLTVGDHQMHHSHRRVNFGLFWRSWDKYMGSYRKCETRAYNFEFWQEWAAASKKSTHPDVAKEQQDQAKKWLGRHQVEFHEVEWGF